MFAQNDHFKKELISSYGTILIDTAAFHKHYIRCNYLECEQPCCAIGSNLHDAEYEELTTLLNQNHCADLGMSTPQEFFEYKDNAVSDKQTALKPWHYKNTAIDFHQTCAFKQQDGGCYLQAKAIQNNQHPWFYKPLECWSFPLVLLKGDSTTTLTIYDKDTPIFQDDVWKNYPTHGSCLKENDQGEKGLELLKTELDALGMLLDRNLYDEIRTSE